MTNVELSSYVLSIGTKLADAYAAKVGAPQALPSWLTTLLDVLLYVLKFLMLFAPFLLLAEMKNPGPFTLVRLRRFSQLAIDDGLDPALVEAVILESWQTADDTYVTNMVAAVKLMEV